MNEAVLEELLVVITPLIHKQDTVMREAISPRNRLAATLHFLATGNTFVELSYSTRIAHNTLSQLVIETLKAIVSALEGKELTCPSTPSEWETVAEQFHAQWQFPHCIGALDGKHINFRPARAEGSAYRNYKNTDSIILLALVNANYQFLFVDIGRNGRMHDSTVFRESVLFQQLSSGALNLPEPCSLPGDNILLPYAIIADDAFPLKSNIMKPYPGRNLTYEKKVFNYRLSRARRIVENAFGILVHRFRILLNIIPLSVEKVELIVYACCLLHNFLIRRNAQWYMSPERMQQCAQTNLQNVYQQDGNPVCNVAMSVRDNFKSYFNGIGAVSWQDLAVKKGN